MLAEFLPGRTPGLFFLGGMITNLRAMLGRTVDLKTPEDLSRYFRHEVLREARLFHPA